MQYLLPEVFLTFEQLDGELIDVSIDDILHSGNPIDPETGEELVLTDDLVTIIKIEHQ